MLRSLESLLHTLQLYGAAGIAAFGWAIGALLGWNAAPWMPLWFCSALLIYNLDRLRRDPADSLNTPLRAAASIRWRAASIAVVAAAAAVLIAVPVARRDWLTLGLVAGGAFVSVQYSVPLLGFRLKDVPFLKSFFAPTIIVAAIFGLPWLHDGDRPGAARAALWAWSYLEFNMILCDLRDLAGDRACGVASLPVRLGARGTRRLLAALLVSAVTFAFLEKWALLAALSAIYLAGLLAASATQRTERFYEWAVEGMLFLPALAVALG